MLLQCLPVAAACVLSLPSLSSLAVACSVEVGLEGAGQQQGAGQRAGAGGQVGDGALAHIHVLHVDEARHVDCGARQGGGWGTGVGSADQGRGRQGRLEGRGHQWHGQCGQKHRARRSHSAQRTPQNTSQQSLQWKEAQGLGAHLTAAAPAAARGSPPAACTAAPAQAGQGVMGR